MLRRGWSIGATLVLALVVFLPAFGTSAPAPQVRAIRGPILVDGDSSFTAANGVTGGSGLATDPYVIAGWDISPSGDFTWRGIAIQNTRLPFVIRDLQINSFPIGVAVANASNGRIESTSFTATLDAVQLTSVSNVSLSGLDTTSSALSMLRIWGAKFVSVADSVLSGGIDVQQSSHVDIVGNRVAGGIGATESSAVRIDRNLPVGDDLGIGTYRTEDVTISRNGAPESEVQRIFVQDSARTVVTDNVLSWKITPGASSLGGFCSLCLIGSTDGIVSGNRMSGDGIYLGGTRPEHYFTNDIENNTVDGKPIRLFRDCLDLRLEGVSYSQVLIVFCSRVVLEGLVFSGPRLALQVAYASIVGISNSTFESETAGIQVAHSKAVDVLGNTFRTGFTSARFVDSEGIRFASNNVSSSHGFDTVEFERTRSIRVEANHLTTPAGSGVSLRSSADVVMAFNVVESWTPVFIDRSHNVTIYSNNFVRFDVPPIVRDSERIAWDAGYSGGGNFWASYSGGDECSGPQQDDCSSPDGFGDTVVSIDATNVDRYPLMNPWAPPPGPRTSLPEPPMVLATILIDLGIFSVPFVIIFILLKAFRGRPPKSAPLPPPHDAPEVPNLITAVVKR